METKRGFAPLLGLVIAGVVILLAVVLFSGNFFQSDSSQDASAPGSSNQMEAQESMEGPADNSMEEKMEYDPPLTETFNHPAGASIKYPETWTLNDEDPEAPSIVSRDPNAESVSGNAAGIVIITSSLPEGAEFESFAKGSGDSFAREFGATAGEASSLTINGADAYRFDFPFTQSGVDLEANLYIVHGGDTAYALFVTGETELLEKYDKTLTKIVNSFQVSEE